jgi:Chaperone of endosialidase
MFMNIRSISVLITLALVTIAARHSLLAVSPPPDGGYPGNNTAEGTNALLSRTTGVNNTALGFDALAHDTSGSNNTATGVLALFANTTGAVNTATGVQALYSNSTGIRNTADGTGALLHNNASYGTATGWAALVNNTSGIANTADGAQALFSNTTGAQNTAVGAGALLHNNASSNTAIGWAAGFNLDSGSDNTFIGRAAGNSEDPDVSDVICIGSLGDSQPAGVATPNRCYIGNIHGVSLGGPADYLQVMVDADGQLGTAVSSARFKKDIKPMDQASEGILKLKPVTFHYKDRDDKNDKRPQFGLIAEDVEKVNRDLVVHGKDRKVLSVRYDAVDVMLLNEFLKEHRRGEQQDRQLREQQKQIEKLTAQLKKQAAQIQKVNHKLEMTRSAPQVVDNTQ